jgi:hypothetical protein
MCSVAVDNWTTQWYSSLVRRLDHSPVVALRWLLYDFVVTVPFYSSWTLASWE